MTFWNNNFTCQSLEMQHIGHHSHKELIDIVRKHMIPVKIVEDVKQAQVCTIMVDKIISYNDELMPVCIRFEVENLNSREEFLELCSLRRILGHHSASASAIRYI